MLALIPEAPAVSRARPRSAAIAGGQDAVHSGWFLFFFPAKKVSNERIGRKATCPGVQSAPFSSWRGGLRPHARLAEDFRRSCLWAL